MSSRTIPCLATSPPSGEWLVAVETVCHCRYIVSETTDKSKGSVAGLQPPGGLDSFKRKNNKKNQNCNSPGAMLAYAQYSQVKHEARVK